MSKQGWFLSTLFLAVTTAACSEPVPTGPAQPPALRIFPGAQSIGLMLGGALRLSVTLTGTHGELLPIPPSFALISRNPTVITIDSVYVVHAKAMGETGWSAHSSTRGSDLLIRLTSPFCAPSSWAGLSRRDSKRYTSVRASHLR